MPRHTTLFQAPTSPRHLRSLRGSPYLRRFGRLQLGRDGIFDRSPPGFHRPRLSIRRIIKSVFVIAFAIQFSLLYTQTRCLSTGNLLYHAAGPSEDIFCSFRFQKRSPHWPPKGVADGIFYVYIRLQNQPTEESSLPSWAVQEPATQVRILPSESSAVSTRSIAAPSSIGGFSSRTGNCPVRLPSVSPSRRRRKRQSVRSVGTGGRV